MIQKLDNKLDKIKNLTNFEYKITNKKVIKYINNLKFDCMDSYNNYKHTYTKMTNKKYNDIINIKIKDIVTEYIKKYIKEFCLYENIYKKENINIKIYSKTTDNIDLINEINSIINMFDNFHILNKEYNIIILLIDINKNINKSYKYPKNINSGRNTFGKIIIFRKEEIHKVLIHELLHYTSNDIRLVNNKLEYIYKEINIITENNLKSLNNNTNEGYVEYMAVILLNIWNYNYKKINKNIIEYMEEKIINENLFNMYQIAKICKLEGYKSYSDLFIKPFIQESFIFEYIFIRYLLLKDPKYLELLLI